MNIIDQ
jgi:hypothetical protein